MVSIFIQSIGIHHMLFVVIDVKDILFWGVWINLLKASHMFLLLEKYDTL